MYSIICNLDEEQNISFVYLLLLVIFLTSHVHLCLLVICTIPSTQATCLKNEKLRISKSIVAAMREVGGRFLERLDGGTSMTIDEKDEDGNPVAYRDIGDRRAVEKTSQG